MAPKSFVLYLILTPLNQYPLQGCNSLMHRLNQPESAVFQLCSFTVFPKDPFFRLFSLLYSLLETPNSWFLQDLRQNVVDRVFERVNMIQENN